MEKYIPHLIELFLCTFTNIFRAPLFHRTPCTQHMVRNFVLIEVETVLRLMWLLPLKSLAMLSMAVSQQEWLTSLQISMWTSSLVPLSFVTDITTYSNWSALSSPPSIPFSASRGCSPLSDSHWSVSCVSCHWSYQWCSCHTQISLRPVLDRGMLYYPSYYLEDTAKLPEYELGTVLVHSLQDNLSSCSVILVCF